MTRRAFFKCEGCGMEIHLLAPVERPCPSCGKDFVEIEEPDQSMRIASEEDVSDLDLGLIPNTGQLSVQSVKLPPAQIDLIIDEEMPAIIEGFEALLAEDARKRGW